MVDLIRARFIVLENSCFSALRHFNYTVCSVSAHPVAPEEVPGLNETAERLQMTWCGVEMFL